jgi:hypothetical protein
MCVQFCGPNDASTPVYEMVLEHTFMELVENIRCETLENVSMREEFPKWFMYCS